MLLASLRRPSALWHRSWASLLVAAVPAGLVLTLAPPSRTRQAARPADPAGTITVVDFSPLNWLSITWNTMEELVRVDRDGRMVPNLAANWRWVDDRTLELKLRQGVAFQDGEQLTAKVFRRSFDEVQRWTVPHPPGAFLNFPKETKLDVVDDYTVRFTFPRPDAAVFMKFRGMHVGSTRFWKELGFIDQKKGTAEGHW
jgi:ABC-type transport system substrate-binding protein